MDESYAALAVSLKCYWSVFEGAEDLRVKYEPCVRLSPKRRRQRSAAGDRRSGSARR